MACGVGASLAALPHRRYRGPQTRSPARTDPREEGRLAHREGVSFRATPMLLGEAGVGKTFLLHAALAHSDLQDLKTVHVWYPKLALHDTFKMICREFGLHEGTYDAGKL